MNKDEVILPSRPEDGYCLPPLSVNSHSEGTEYDFPDMLNG